MASKNISYPFEEFSLPVKIIVFFLFLLIFFIGSIEGYKTSQLLRSFTSIFSKIYFYPCAYKKNIICVFNNI